MLTDRKMNAEEMARTLEMSSFLVREYLENISIYMKEFKGG